MSFFFSILSLGFLLGIRHATDADHITAVTTFVSREQNISRATGIGILWGIGHSLSVTLVALPIILFSFTIPQHFSLVFEFMVGIMLVVLGLINITLKIHSHTHEHSDRQTHKHKHVHFLGLFHTFRPLIIGLIHGLAGSAAIVILISSTIKDPRLAVLYLLIFHLGVIVGMMLITTFLGVSVSVIRRKSETINKYLVIFSGLASLIFGLYILFSAI